MHGHVGGWRLQSFMIPKGPGSPPYLEEAHRAPVLLPGGAFWAQSLGTIAPGAEVEVAIRLFGRARTHGDGGWSLSLPLTDAPIVRSSLTLPERIDGRSLVEEDASYDVAVRVHASAEGMRLQAPGLEVGADGAVGADHGGIAGHAVVARARRAARR